ncbi:MAG: 3-hydroxyacyl-CoA dehydrogenase NAD-binding domain-containing protein, partial [Acidiferrobacteraceae bacterium]
IKLGIHPGFGGTQRLPQRVGHLAALDLMLKGRAIGAREARRIGLVDAVVPERHLLTGGIDVLHHPPARRLAWWKQVPGFPPVRPLVARLLKPRLARKARPEHYPAPHRLLDLWARAGGLDDEAVSLGELLVTPASRHLVHLFLIGEDLKRSARATDHKVQHVHVVGAGVMGGDIAIWAAHRGFTVTLQDQRPQAIAHAMRRASAFLRKELRDARAIQAVLDRIIPDTQGRAPARADLIIEAIVEDEQAKCALFADLEAKVPEHVLFASNTSSIPIERLGAPLRRPGRLFGLHFFNPVARMPLIEVVRGGATDEETLARGRSFAGALDRFPLVVASTPGFLVNRALMPYLLEAVLMLEEDIPAPVIDASAVAFGMPMGPVALADTVGLDVCLSVAEHLSGVLATEVPERLRVLVASGRLGKKSGHGFYRYDRAGHPVDAPAGREDREIGERLVWRLVNEAAACLRAGVVADADLVDAGLVFGTGFAPFRGGPLRYAEDLGSAAAHQNLARLTRVFGARFTPDEGWSRPGFFARRALAP